MFQAKWDGWSPKIGKLAWGDHMRNVIKQIFCLRKLLISLGLTSLICKIGLIKVPPFCGGCEDSTNWYTEVLRNYSISSLSYHYYLCYYFMRYSWMHASWKCNETTTTNSMIFFVLKIYTHHNFNYSSLSCPLLSTGHGHTFKKISWLWLLQIKSNRWKMKSSVACRLSFNMDPKSFLPDYKFKELKAPTIVLLRLNEWKSNYSQKETLR